MARIITIDVETHPRFDSLDCFAYINGQSYRLVRDPPQLQDQPSISREFVAQTLRQFADYIEHSCAMSDSDVSDGRGSMRGRYREGRLGR